jgi:hypothetical protein
LPERAAVAAARRRKIATSGNAEALMFKIEVADEHDRWTDVRGSDGSVLVFEKEDEARAKLAQLYPVLVQMEKYGGRKRTRVIRILGEDEDDDWPAKRPAP